MNACPIDGCDVEINTLQLLMCREHWFMVPRELRAEVWAAWRGRQSAGLSASPDDYDAAVERHEHAKAVAINAVNEKVRAA